jgi:hypothetical protein
MTISAPLVIAIAFVAPLLVLIVVGRVKLYRSKSESERQSIHFDPKAEPAPNVLLRRFNLPQRTYLRQQYRIALAGFALCAYVLFVTASLGLLPKHIHMYSSARLYQRIWQSYVKVFTATGHLSFAFAFLSGLLAISYLKTPASAVFIRSRPLSHKFLFWGRTTFALAGLLTGTLTAIGASILLLFLIYGPVWKLASDPPASVFRLGLSMLTTAGLAFSITVCGSCLARRSRMRGGWKLPLVLFGVIFGFLAIPVSHLAVTTQIPRILFLFPAQASTERLAFALVPILSAAALLWLAQHLSTHFEI